MKKDFLKQMSSATPRVPWVEERNGWRNRMSIRPRSGRVKQDQHNAGRSSPRRRRVLVGQLTLPVTEEWSCTFGADGQKPPRICCRFWLARSVFVLGDPVRDFHLAMKWLAYETAEKSNKIKRTVDACCFSMYTVYFFKKCLKYISMVYYPCSLEVGVGRPICRRDMT